MIAVAEQDVIQEIVEKIDHVTPYPKSTLKEYPLLSSSVSSNFLQLGAFFPLRKRTPENGLSRWKERHHGLALPLHLMGNDHSYKHQSVNCSYCSFDNEFMVL